MSKLWSVIKMDQQKIDMFVMTNQKVFSGGKDYVLEGQTQNN